MSAKSLVVAIVGCGTVGRATAQLLSQRRKFISSRSGVDIYLKAIVVRSTPPKLSPELTGLLTQDLHAILNDPEIDCIVELIGGIDEAFDIIHRSLMAKKHVVTANKALLALRGSEILSFAHTQKRCIGFEASCGGGIPLIRALTEGLIANNIQGMFGIINGTSNYILTEMIEKGLSYDEALLSATQKGYAEADPSLDVSGYDAAHKIAIMSSLAFDIDINFPSIEVQGIEDIDSKDMYFARKLGYVVKSIAAAYRLDSGVCIWVRPVFLSKEHPLSGVRSSFNALSVYGDVTGHSLYYGRGAGGNPTASAIISDIIGIGIGTSPTLFLHREDSRALSNLEHLPAGRGTNRYFIRMHMDDKPGVIAKTTHVLANYDISIASVWQDEIPENDDGKATVIITTHRSNEAKVREAVESINQRDFIHSKCRLITILDEHPESISE